jgi:hypothetical protein
LYHELKEKNISHLAIYTAQEEKLVNKYIKRGFKPTIELKEKNT